MRLGDTIKQEYYDKDVEDAACTYQVIDMSYLEMKLTQEMRRLKKTVFYKDKKEVGEVILK